MLRPEVDSEWDALVILWRARWHDAKAPKRDQGPVKDHNPFRGDVGMVGAEVALAIEFRSDPIQGVGHMNETVALMFLRKMPNETMSVGLPRGPMRVKMVDRWGGDVRKTFAAPPSLGLILNHSSIDYL